MAAIEFPDVSKLYPHGAREEISQGVIRIAERAVNDVSAKDRDIADVRSFIRA
jgi:hypothetical protein